MSNGFSIICFLGIFFWCFDGPWVSASSMLWWPFVSELCCSDPIGFDIRSVISVMATLLNFNLECRLDFESSWLWRWSQSIESLTKAINPDWANTKDERKQLEISAAKSGMPNSTTLLDTVKLWCCVNAPLWATSTRAYHNAFSIST